MGEWDEKTWPQLHEALRVARATLETLASQGDEIAEDTLQQIERILSQDWTGDGDE